MDEEDFSNHGLLQFPSSMYHSFLLWKLKKCGNMRKNLLGRLIAETPSIGEILTTAQDVPNKTLPAEQTLFVGKRLCWTFFVCNSLVLDL
jgi:hypothetical protein